MGASIWGYTVHQLIQGSEGPKQLDVALMHFSKAFNKMQLCRPIHKKRHNDYGVDYNNNTG